MTFYLCLICVYPKFRNQKNRGWTQINTDEAVAKTILIHVIHLGGEALLEALDFITHLSVSIYG
jgi:hypothetical protein